jgi:hypothetical protein
MIMNREFNFTANVRFRYWPIFLQFGRLNVSFLLISQKWMEKCYHEIGVDNFRCGMKKRKEKLFDFWKTLFSDGFDV